MTGWYRDRLYWQYRDRPVSLLLRQADIVTGRCCDRPYRDRLYLDRPYRDRPYRDRPYRDRPYRRYRDSRSLSLPAQALSLLLLPGLGRRVTTATAATMEGTAGTAPGTAPGTAGDTCGSAGNGTAGGTGDSRGDSRGDSAGDTGDVSAAFVTCPNLSVATELARALVQQRLAACVNIVPGVTSVYTWQGKLEEDSEVLLMIKTRSSRVPALSDFVRSHHPYEVPEVVALPVAQGNPPYLRWVRDAVPP
ncbi:protein CutA 1, chloroplastic-like [Passer montanus]|uniref:protein CutA 1, chloroplastic-like n=1 Tax=Passer montanus TaxID=9160 RepID=UPI0019607C85|nr:protein CutA 1, chloroplastic-like [Passer montanus]